MSKATAAEQNPKAPTKKHDRTHYLYVAVIVAVAAGILVGWLAPSVGKSMAVLGTTFLSLIKMIVAPIIFCTIVTGVGSVRKAASVGKIGALAMVYFLLASTVAMAIGLVVGNWIQPGGGLNVTPSTSQAAADLAGNATSGTTDFIKSIIPTTLVSSLTSGNIMQTLFVALIVGFALQALGRHGGLLPTGVTTSEVQARRTYAQFSRQSPDLAKWVYLANLRDRNEALFYRLLSEHIEEMPPIVYTPIYPPTGPNRAGRFNGVVKLSDVARRAGVGVGTASRAISGKGYVDPSTRERVLAAAAELDYRPNAAARALRERRTRVVGLLLPDITNEFYTASAAVLQTVLADAGLQLIVATTGNDPTAEQHALKAMLDRQVDGIVHVPVDPDVTLPTEIPLVQLNRYSSGAAAPAVLSDDIHGVAELTRHIIAAGHTDLAVITGPTDLSTSRERLAGYRQAVAAAGIPEVTPGTATSGGPRSRVLVCPFSIDGGAQGLARLADDPPQAVLALSSRLVMGVLQAAGARSIRIPDDLSIAGFGDPEWFAIWQPSITTYAPPLPRMGRRAAEILLTLIENDTKTSTPEMERIPGALRIRQSVRHLSAHSYQHDR